MSFLGRFLGGRSSAYSEGMALLEQERFAEAADRFRSSLAGRSDAPSDSLASFHFRQALVSEGRRLLRAGKPANAAPWFAEAVENWDLYPDLHCLLGTARGRAGNWDAALAEARLALRRNPDYIEARLLEATALVELDREREALDSLEKLRESGRRVDHWLIDVLATEGDAAGGGGLPNLGEMLDQAVSGRSEKEEVADAVAECRAGNWEVGLERFAALVAKRPRYPDYRTRHAAALFQLGRNDDALAEVEAALALNESYRTAIDLKGLILADRRRIFEARAFLLETDESLERRGGQGDLFGSYLRGALALLAGQPEAVEPLLADRSNLVREFARAELLLAAADDLRGRESRCGERLETLAREWPAEAVYFHLLACHHLRSRRYGEAHAALARWPAGQKDDPRPLYLGAVIAAERGEVDDRIETLASRPDAADAVPEPALRFLRARHACLRGEYTACAEACAGLVAEGLATERVLEWWLGATVRAGRADPASPPRPVVPEACLPAWQTWRLAAAADADSRDAVFEGADPVEAFSRVHPESPLTCWLSPGFWLDPIRGWIG